MSRTNLIEFKNTMSRMLDAGELPLPSTIDPAAFRNAAIFAVQDSADILAKCTPESIFRAMRDFALMGLVPDGRLAALVRYGDKASAQMMYAGMIQLVHNTGLVLAIKADVIYEGETLLLTNENGMQGWQHVKEDGSQIDLMQRGGKIIGALATAKLKNGASDFEAMTADQIELRRLSSPNQRGKEATGIWKDWKPEMYKKTPLRALCKRLPMSSEYYTRIEHDPGFREMRDVTPEPPRVTTEERLTKAMQAEQDAAQSEFQSDIDAQADKHA